jgi:tRNA-dihydrouridine synthase
MAELSNRPLRELVESFGGADEYFTEMISAAAFVAGSPFEEWYGDAGPVPGKAVYQLVGSDPEKLAAAAALLDGSPCRGIDLNMGCAAPPIVRGGSGIRWMEDADKAGRMAALVRKAVKNARLSVKLRLGGSVRGPDETPDALFEKLVPFCKRLEEEGVELITLHPRTAKEKFKRAAHWKYVPLLRGELGIPVAGNGDVSSPEEMLRRSEMCDAVMVGRAAIKQPWIFKEASALRQGLGIRDQGSDRLIPDPCPLSPVIDSGLIRDTGLRFIELLSRYQPPEFHVSRARRFFGYFCDNLAWGNYVKNLLNREETLSGIEEAWIKCLTLF